MLPIDYALIYARRGWPVFPCNPCIDPPDAKRRRSKGPLVPGADKDAQGKKVPKTGGLWRASTDEAVIREWWRRWPNALIGMPTGRRSGVFVIDLDPHDETAEGTEARLVEAVGLLPPGPRSKTQSGGVHIWFAVPDDGEIPRNSAKRLKNIDWRGDGGYVIVPPSKMQNGAEYVWTVPPKDAPFPQMTPLILDLVFQRGVFDRGYKATDEPSAAPASAPPPVPKNDDPRGLAIRKYAVAALERARGDVAKEVKGARGHTINAAAYGIAGFVALGILSEREVMSALQDAADACGLTATDGAQERDAKIRRGLAAGGGNTDELRRRLAEVGEKAVRRAGRGHADAPWPDADPAAPPVGNRPSQGSLNQQNIPNQPTGGDPPDRNDGPDTEDVKRCSRLDQNDTDNGARLIAHFGKDMLVVRDVGPHIWAQTHWQLSGGDEAFVRFAQQTAKYIRLETDHLDYTAEEAAVLAAADSLDRSALAIDGRSASHDDRARKAAALRVIAAAEQAESNFQERESSRRRFSVASGNAPRINGMISQGVVHMTILPDDLDADPMAINVRNGTLRLVKEKVREVDPDCPDPDITRYHTVTRWRVVLEQHRRADRISKIMPVEYDSSAECPQFEKFIARFQPEESLRGFLQRFHGYGLTGLTGEQVFVFNYGRGANGKTTFIETIARLQGSYAHLLPAESVTGDSQRRGDQATPEFARLAGARLVRCSELPPDERLREGTIKLLTGGEPLLVRHLHKRFFEFRPVFKAIGSGNTKPYISGVDEGIWRRVLLVPWTAFIPVNERKPIEAVLRRFMAEAPGILNWLLSGLVEYLETGLRVPDEIRAATQEYRADMDPVGEFVRSCVVPSPGNTVTARSMFEAYTAWCGANSVRPRAERKFAEIMSDKGYRKELGRIRTYLDVQLSNVPEDPSKRNDDLYSDDNRGGYR